MAIVGKDKILFDDGNTATVYYGPWQKWEVVANIVSSFCDCDPEDVDACEGDDGDFIAVKGVRVGRLQSTVALEDY